MLCSASLSSGLTAATSPPTLASASSVGTITASTYERALLPYTKI
jgi:hypothetical protein